MQLSESVEQIEVPHNQLRQIANGFFEFLTHILSCHHGLDEITQRRELQVEVCEG